MPTRNAYDSLSDTDLVKAVLAGEPAAWPTFYAKHERLVYSCIRKVLYRYHAQYNDEDLEDLASATALNIVKDEFKKLRMFDPNRGYKLSSWVGLIATNTAHDALRRRGPDESGRATSVEEAGDHAGELAHDTPPADEILEERDRARLLREAIAALGPSDQTFVTYYFVDELEPEEIARLMNISINTVYSRKSKIRDKLKGILDEQRASGEG